MDVEVTLKVDGTVHQLAAETGTSPSDALQDGSRLTTTKLGCSQEACGACTVLVEGKRVLSCMT